MRGLLVSRYIQWSNNIISISYCLTNALFLRIFRVFILIEFIWNGEFSLYIKWLKFKRPIIVFVSSTFVWLISKTIRDRVRDHYCLHSILNCLLLSSRNLFRWNWERPRSKFAPILFSVLFCGFSQGEFCVCIQHLFRSLSLFFFNCRSILWFDCKFYRQPIRDL